MRWICWASVPLAVCGLMRSAAGLDSTYGWGGTCASCQQGYGYDAPACAAPFFGFQPGCCESPPSPCDNAWAGYCQEKARCRDFCYRLGTGAGIFRGWMPGICQAMPGATEPCGQPLPGLPEEPEGPAVPAAPGQRAVPTVPGEPTGPVGPGVPGAPPVPVPPGGLPDAPLPRGPADLGDPLALPPLPGPLPDETTRIWDRLWRPWGSARDQRAERPRLR
jgi:hypothetical protein